MSKVVNKDHRPFCNNKQLKEQALMDLSCMTVTQVAQKYGVNPSTISRLQKDNKPQIDALSEEIYEENKEKFLKGIHNDIGNYYELTELGVGEITNVQVSLKTQLLKYLVVPLAEKEDILPSRNININVNHTLDITPLLLAAEERMKNVDIISMKNGVGAPQKQLVEGKDSDTDTM